MNEINMIKSVKPTFWRVILFMLKVTFIGWGGGNALMPIIKRYAVDRNHWITIEEFDQMVIATNLIPGPSVMESLSYVAIKVLGKFKGIIATLIGVLPHVLLALGLFIIIENLDRNYLYVVAAGIMPVILAILINFIIRYVKLIKKELSLMRGFLLIILSCTFTFFVPSPYNIPAFIMILVIVVLFIHGLWTSRKDKKQTIKKGGK